MKFYYEIEYVNGAKMGGHNCTGVKIKKDSLILEGFDEYVDCGGEKEHYWRNIEKLKGIKSFKFERTEEDFE